MHSYLPSAAGLPYLPSGLTQAEKRMPLDSALITKVEALEGGAELAKTLREKWGADATALDTVTGESRTLQQALKAAAAERAKFKSDLATAGKDREGQLTKLVSERDALARGDHQDRRRPAGRAGPRGLRIRAHVKL